MTLQLAKAADKQLVTALIVHSVKPGKEPDYEQWLRGISRVAQQFEGHCGVNYIRAAGGVHGEYTIILKFDCYQNLKRWMDSSLRKQWLDKVKPMIYADENIQILTGLETWFTLPGKAVQNPPKRYKMVIITTIAVFFVAQLLGYLTTPLLQFLPDLLGIFVSTALTVFLLVYVVMPRVTRLFYRWLYPRNHINS